MGRILILAMFILSSNSFARTTGDIHFSDGTTSVRISVGNNDSSSRALLKRIKRLEKAVGHLQLRVYELEDGGVENRDSQYICTVTACRKSASIHRPTERNCAFFNMYKEERITIWATGGAEAESIALRKLRTDSDVALVQETTLSCRN